MLKTLSSIFVMSVALAVISPSASSAGLEHALARVAKQLLDYDRGVVEYDDLFKPGSDEACKQMAAYYFARSNDLTLKMKLPVSRCLGFTEHYTEAASLARDYLAVYTNDWRGWRVVGVASLMLKDYNASIYALTNALALGDSENLSLLGYAAVTVGRLDVVDRFSAAMLARKKLESTSEQERLDLTVVLVGFANKAKRPKVLIDALRGVPAGQISSRPELQHLIVDACDIFKDDKAVAELCGKLRSDPDWKPASNDKGP